MFYVRESDNVNSPGLALQLEDVEEGSCCTAAFRAMLVVKHKVSNQSNHKKDR